MTDNAAFRPASELAHACRDLLASIYDDETKSDMRRAALDREAGVDGSSWWQGVLEIVDNCDDIKDKPEELARFATPIIECLLEDVPGIEVTSVLLGGTSMMAGFGNFVWSRDREAAIAAIAHAIESATFTVTSVVAVVRQA